MKLKIKTILVLCLFILLFLIFRQYRIYQAKIFFEKAHQYLSCNKPVKAVRVLENKVLLYSPNFAEAHFVLGKVLYEKFNYLDNARYHLTKYLDLLPHADYAKRKQATDILNMVIEDIKYADAFGTLPPPPGNFVNAGTSGISSNKKRTIVTYYYYWYDTDSNSHIHNEDGSDYFTLHPPSGEPFSYNSVYWHKKQLSDMAYAGIDIVLPVFWGRVGYYGKEDQDSWSFTGLKYLVMACAELENEGKPFPKIGLFLDENIFAYHFKNIFNLRTPIDLTTNKGMALLYGSIRDFFSMIPPKYRASINGVPVIWIFISLPISPNCNQLTFDYIEKCFFRDFAQDPYVVIDYRFEEVKTDANFSWGAALTGPIPDPANPIFKSPIVCIGPGYDDSKVKGRIPTVVSRENGEFYRSNWNKIIESDYSIIAIETWNEFHEGSAIAETSEWGRKYIEMTRKFTSELKDR